MDWFKKVGDGISRGLGTSAAPSEDWACSQCTFKNPASAQSCEMCGTAKGASPNQADAVAPPTAPPTYNDPTTVYEEPPPAIVPPVAREPSEVQVEPTIPPPAVRGASHVSEWSCAVCTLVNRAGATSCEACGSPAPAPAHTPSPPTQPAQTPLTAPTYPPTSTAAAAAAATAAPVPIAVAATTDRAPWTCSVCTFRNENGESVCGACESPAPAAAPVPVATPAVPPGPPSAAAPPVAAGPWTCPACTFHNAGGTSCEMCGTARPPSTATPPVASVVSAPPSMATAPVATAAPPVAPEASPPVAPEASPPVAVPIAAAAGGAALAGGVVAVAVPSDSAPAEAPPVGAPHAVQRRSRQDAFLRRHLITQASPQTYQATARAALLFRARAKAAGCR